jgi:hypothetical protein
MNSAFSLVARIAVAVMLCVTALTIVIVAAAGGAGVYHAQCVAPGEEALRFGIPFVRYLAAAEFEKEGKLRNEFGEQFEPGHAPPLGLGRIFQRYRVGVRRVQAGDEVAIRPKHLGVCRPTYVLYDRATKLRIE